MSITVQSGQVVVQDPSDIRVYVFDWDAENLPDGAAISGSATWTISAVIPSDATLMTKDQESILSDNRKAQVRLQGGTVGARYNIACKISTNESPQQTKEQSFDILVEHR